MQYHSSNAPHGAARIPTIRGETPQMNKIAAVLLGLALVAGTAPTAAAKTKTDKVKKRKTKKPKS